MKFRGGYNLLLKGKPSSEVKELPEPDILHLPLFSQHLNFSNLCVDEGEEVEEGQILANDPDHFSVPLLAPGNGTVKLDKAGRCIDLVNVQKSLDKTINIETDIPDEAKNRGVVGEKLYKLLRLGAWQYFSHANTGEILDPYRKPQAVIISASHLEPFLVRVEALLNNRISNLSQGLEHLHEISENQPIYMVIPRSRSDYILRIKDIVRKNSWIKPCEVPLRYPFDNFKLLARYLGLDNTPDKDPVWSLGIEGILAIDRVLSSSKPCISRIISIAGPGTKRAEHVKAVIGYPLEKMLEPYKDGNLIRIINGGVFTGETLDTDQKGLDVECKGLTLVPEHDKREVLAFAHLGFTKHAFSNTFLSAIRLPFRERYTTGIRAEQRPCISCCFCEDVCPSGLMPHLIRQYVDKNRLEDAERFGLSLCVQCGLCSHVCTSKIEIKQKLFEAQEKLKQEFLLSQEQI